MTSKTIKRKKVPYNYIISKTSSVGILYPIPDFTKTTIKSHSNLSGKLLFV